MLEINDMKIKTDSDLVLLPRQEDYQKEIASFLEHWFDKTSYIETKTSGSTGKPKMIKLLKTAMEKSAELTNQFFNLKKGDTALICLPSDYIAGKLMIVRSIKAQLKLISVKPSLNPLKNINSQIYFAAMTPMQVKTILKETPKKLNLIKTLIIGGAPVDYTLENNLKQISTKCYSTFGMTETITHIAVKELNKNNNFIALPTITFKKSKNNCLIINAPHIQSTPILTNDLVELTSSNSFIWKGRVNNVINSGGIKIIAEELELLLLKSIPNNRYFIANEKDELLGERIILIIEGEKTVELDFNFLPKYWSPKKIYYTPQFIESKNRKILKQKTINTLNQWEKK